MKKYSNGGMPPIGDSVASGNRMSKAEGDEMRSMGVGMKPKAKAKPTPAEIAAGKSGNRMSGENAKDMKAVKKYAKGGSASSRADGCAVKGKTKGRII
jgi:hypothetical protein